jgi:hypothetical protein
LFFFVTVIPIQSSAARDGCKKNWKVSWRAIEQKCVWSFHQQHRHYQESWIKQAQISSSSFNMA